MQELYIKVPGTSDTSYRIMLGSGLLPSVWSAVEAGFPKARRFVVTDANVVAAGHVETLLQGQDAPSYVIRPAGEPSKNIDTAVAIVDTHPRTREAGRTQSCSMATPYMSLRAKRSNLPSYGLRSLRRHAPRKDMSVICHTTWRLP